MTRDIKKKQKSLFKKLFHSTSPQVKENDVQGSILSLRKLAKTKEQKDILKLIECETIPSVRDAWIECLLEKTRLSKCKKGD